MIFDELDILYSEIDNEFAVKEFNTRINGLESEEWEIALKREMNEQSYFLYMFTRLEKRIIDLSDTLIENKKKSVVDNKDMNAWRLVKKRRLELMERVSFFTSPGGRDYNLIYDYKKKRDSIAHGDYATGINIPSILVDMKRLYNDLDN